MKTLALSSLLFLLATNAMAQTPPGTVAVVLPTIEAAVERNGTERSDAGCNRAGVKVYDSVALTVGLVRNSAGILKDLMAKTSTQTATLEADASYCGNTCQQVNLVSTMTASVPNSWGDIGSCTSTTPQVIEKEFANGDALQSYVSDTLAAKNADGKQVNAVCPSACSYHIASSITPMAGTGEHLNLSILCGPPRSGMLPFAKYFFTAGLIQQWSCKRK